jgi:hypothetical protein
MLGKILMLPIVLLRSVFGIGFGAVKLVFKLGGGVLRFLFKNSIGVIIGAVLAIFLGKKFIEGNKQEEE